VRLRSRSSSSNKRSPVVRKGRAPRSESPSGRRSRRNGGGGLRAWSNSPEMEAAVKASRKAEKKRPKASSERVSLRVEGTISGYMKVSKSHRQITTAMEHELEDDGGSPVKLSGRKKKRESVDVVAKPIATKERRGHDDSLFAGQQAAKKAKHQQGADGTIHYPPTEVELDYGLPAGWTAVKKMSGGEFRKFYYCGRHRKISDPREVIRLHALDNGEDPEEALQAYERKLRAKAKKDKKLKGSICERAGHLATEEPSKKELKRRKEAARAAQQQQAQNSEESRSSSPPVRAKSAKKKKNKVKHKKPDRVPSMRGVSMMGAPGMMMPPGMFGHMATAQGMTMMRPMGMMGPFHGMAPHHPMMFMGPGMSMMGPVGMQGQMGTPGVSSMQTAAGAMPMGSKKEPEPEVPQTKPASRSSSSSSSSSAKSSSSSSSSAGANVGTESAAVNTATGEEEAGRASSEHAAERGAADDDDAGIAAALVSDQENEEAQPASPLLPPPGIETPPELRDDISMEGADDDAGAEMEPRPATTAWIEVAQDKSVEDLEREKAEIEQRKNMTSIATQTITDGDEIPEDCADRWFAGLAFTAATKSASVGSQSADEASSSSDSSEDGAEEPALVSVPGPQQRLKQRARRGMGASAPHPENADSAADASAAGATAAARSRSSSVSSSSSSSTSSSDGSHRQRATSSEREECLTSPMLRAALAATVTGISEAPAVAPGVDGIPGPAAFALADARMRAMRDYSDI